MADVSITAANVVHSSTTQTTVGVGGEAGTAGQIVYLNSSDGKLYLADADDTAKDEPVGILLCTMVANQKVVYATAGPITIGGTLSPGQSYYMSETAGGLAPVADTGGTSMRIVRIGYATSASVLNIDIEDTGVTTSA